MRRDRGTSHRGNYERNKKRILKTQDTCGICGFLVDKNLPYGDKMAPVIDHIIPVAKGGHPSDIRNLQLAHWTCNSDKSDKLFKNNEVKERKPEPTGNRNLPQSMRWDWYRS